MARTGTSETLASHVYEQIRTEILNGQLVPSQRLKPAELRVRYGVSVSVVREALSRLAEQRLVISHLNHGFEVVPLSEKHLRDLTTARAHIEGFALRLSVERGDFEWESAVVAAHHLLARTPARSASDPTVVTDEWVAAHRKFHRTLIQACDISIVLDLCESLFDASELYRRLSARFNVGVRDVAAEHRRLMEAAVAHDAELAERLLGEHFWRTTTDIVENVGEIGS